VFSGHRINNTQSWFQERYQINNAPQNPTAARPHGSHGGEGCYPKVARSLLRLVMGRNNAFSTLRWHFRRGILVVGGRFAIAKERPCSRRYVRIWIPCRLPNLTPCMAGIRKAFASNSPKGGVRFGILRPFNVSSEAFNWTACLGTVKILNRLPGGWRRATNAVP